MFDSLRTGGFHPSYNSTFRVFKARNDWNQTLRADQRFGSGTVNTTLQSTNTRDEDQNDLDAATAGISSRLTYGLFGGLDVGFFADFDRSARSLRTSNVRSSTDLFRLTGGYATAMIDSSLLLNVDGQAGLRQSDTESALTAGSSGSRDVTRQQGPSLEIRAGLTNDRPFDAPQLTFDIDVSADAFRQETDQVNQDLAGDFTTVVASSDTTFKSTNSTRTASVGFGWEPSDALDVDLRIRQHLSTQVRPQPRQAALESTEGDDRSANLTVRWQPTDKLDVTVGVDAQDSDQTSNLTTSSNRTLTGSGYSIDVDYELFGAAIDASLEQSTEERDYKPLETGSSQIDQSRDYIRTSLKAQRKLTKTITVNLTFDLALDQNFYNDGILDVDRQDRTSDVALTYRPSQRFTGRLSLTENRQRTVNLHPSNAGNTGTQERVTVGAGYTLRVLSWVLLAQDVSINAQSRTFDFNDADQSELTRNNRLQTNVSVDLTTRTELSLEHAYNFRNSGRYALDDRGIRLFTLNREFAEQRLLVGTTYRPRTWLTFSGEQSLRVVVNRSPGDEGTRQTQYELELFGQLNKRLVHDVQANFQVTRVLSTREDNYWRVSLAANKTF